LMGTSGSARPWVAAYWFAASTSSLRLSTLNLVVFPRVA
jgi:alkanesulfonate monooxygenase SsuD/methylene tetrahydromethanopterin reductase-like flavin-dependent oxidoreductase (luciferase family)